MTPQRRSLPPDAMIETSDGLRRVHWTGGAAGSVLFLGGRGDFIEKYAEALWDWRSRGFAVASFDWRGQGGSGRLGRGQAGHADSFEPWLDDLGDQLAWFEATLPPPWFVVAHSMGGHLLLRHLAGGPSRLTRVVLLAPMLGLAVPPLGPAATSAAARAMVGLGQAGRYAPLQGPYDTRRRGPARQRLLTGDTARFDDEAWWLGQHPELALGGVTWGWLAAAFASVAALTAPGVLERIAVPCLALLAEHEGLVDNAAAAAALARVPGARVETIADAAHELLRETDAVRLPVLDRIGTYLAP